MRPLGLLDDLRKLRHKINYYDYMPSKTEAENTVSIAKACFFPLFKEIKKELMR